MRQSHPQRATGDASGAGAITGPVDGVLDRLDRWTTEQSDAAAVIEAGTAYSFGDLDEAARTLTSCLTGMAADAELIGVCLPRSAATVAGAVGIARAGAVYLPLGVNGPVERVLGLVTDAGIRVALVSDRSALLEPLTAAGVRVVAVRHDIRRWAELHATSPSTDRSGGSRQAVMALARPAADRALYGVYTSGSTGKPKAVIVGHRSLANLVSWFTRTYSLTTGDRMALLVSETFDVHLMELWSSLYAGSALVVVDDETRLAPARLAELLRGERVNVCFLPTPLGEAFLAHEWSLPDMRHLLLGGDRLRDWVPGPPGSRVHNQYGPAEATVVSTSFPLGTDCSVGPPPIGYPVDNAVVYVVGESGQLLSRGETGELYIGGAGVALGYLNRPELTAERFVVDAWGRSGGSCYRTGDRVRMREDGALEFLGRFDDQVKIRGFRIEPGEIEAALQQHPSVQAAAVVAVEVGSEQRLLAYVVAEASTPDPGVLQQFLATTLPDYMVPMAIEVLPELPLTRNNKVDRAALRKLGTRQPTTAEYVAPAPGVETTLATIWAEVLKVDRVGATDNFVELGGHSLLAVHVLETIEQTIGQRPSLRAFMRARNLREFGTALAQSAAASEPRD